MGAALGSVQVSIYSRMVDDPPGHVIPSAPWLSAETKETLPSAMKAMEQGPLRS